MRIIHTADWHIGRSFHGVPLLEEQRKFLAWLAELAAERAADAVVVSGDIYDRALPGVEAVRVLEEGLDAIAGHARVVLIPGNHDSAQRLGFGSRWFDDRLRIQPTVAGATSPIELPGAAGRPGLLVYAVPYLDPDLARPDVARLAGVVPADLGRSHEAILRPILQAARDDLARRRATGPRMGAICLAHAFVAGGSISESERDIRIGGVDVVPAEVFAGFDYVALGHLHGPQAVGETAATMRYAGSPLAFSFSEKDHRKSVAIVDIAPDGVVRVDLVETPVPRPLSDIEGTLEEVLSPGHAAQRDHWVRITVRGKTRPDNLLGTLRRVFPHVVEHRFVPLEAVGAGPVGVARDIADPLAVADLFVEQVTGAAATPPEQAVLRHAYERALRDGRGV
ncbi:MAG: exonuclease SbcCD subunit D C-terminal domain-containing protein [Actinomycetia bacterium]|nr:exonuclease SbcCD subunit D C-terminal domain-containing protein [Actinomycetes bacterium]